MRANRQTMAAIASRGVTVALTAVMSTHASGEKPPSLANLTRDSGSALIVEVPVGIYTTAGFRTLQGLPSSADKPLVLRAANRGKAVIVGEAGFTLRDSERVVIEGFVFENDSDQQSVQLVDCRHVRVTRNVFRPQERTKLRHWEHWVTVEGARSGHNQIDRNFFERKVNRGSPLFIRGDDAARWAEEARPANVPSPLTASEVGPNAP